MTTSLGQTLLVFRRSLRLSLRQPVWVVMGLTQPILYLALFGPLLEKVADTPGFPAGDPWQVFVPGLLVQLGLFGAAFVGFGLVEEIRNGVVERERVSPASRTALLLGRVLRDVVVLVFQGVLLVLTAVLFGLDAPVLPMLAGIAVVAVLGGAFASVSYALALKLKSEDALVPILNGTVVPLLLLSGILLPMTLAPGWLETLSDVNPLKHVVDGVRAMFLGDVWTARAGWGAVAAVALAGLAVLAGRRTFQRESA
jgi:ABC-2 type transport system permease protein